MSLIKARFDVFKSDGSLAYFIPVQFNPTELAYAKSNQIAEIAIPGLDSPVLQYVYGNAETIQLELFFDVTDFAEGHIAVSVTEMTDRIYGLMKQERETHAPPKCRFAWGMPTASGPAMAAASGGAEASAAPFWFSCVVESVDRRFTMFNSDGVPIRARLNVRLREYKTVDQMVARLGSADHSKARVLKRGQRLEQISTAEYETPSQWRRIARTNDIDDPRRVEPGTLLRVPPVRPASVVRRSPQEDD